jgi:bacterioferritin-associated ferredoxin
LATSQYFNGHQDEIEIRLKLRSIWFKTTGVLERPYLKKGRKLEELLCRCVGVYAGDLAEVLERDAQTTFNQMIGMTAAASTCMSCMHDIQEHWQKARDQYSQIKPVDALGHRYRPKNLAPADFALELQDHLILWSKREALPSAVKLEITALVGLTVTVKVLGSDQAESYLRALEDYWRSALGVRIQVALEI